jgi:hypothetical protein
MVFQLHRGFLCNFIGVSENSGGGEWAQPLSEVKKIPYLANKSLKHLFFDYFIQNTVTINDNIHVGKN